MVKAILDGKKTQTRRVIKPQPIEKLGKTIHGEDNIWYEWNLGKPHSISGVGEHILRLGLLNYCPYGQVGDRLWLREAFAKRPLPSGGEQILYKAQYHELVKMLDLDEFAERWQLPMPNIRWKPSIHMFRKESRITLEITEVRVERVQEITEEDTQAEGIDVKAVTTQGNLVMNEPNYIDSFAMLWDSLNAKRGYSFESNPWVWVITFKVVR